MTKDSLIAKEVARKRYEEIRIEKKNEIDEFQVRRRASQIVPPL